MWTRREILSHCNCPGVRDTKPPWDLMLSLLMSALGTAVSTSSGVNRSPFVWQGFQPGCHQVSLTGAVLSPPYPPPTRLASGPQKARLRPAQLRVAFHLLLSRPELGSCLPSGGQLCCCLCFLSSSERCPGVPLPSVQLAGWRKAGCPVHCQEDSNTRRNS